MESEERTGGLIYLYGIVPDDAPDPPAGLPGLDGGRVRLLRAGPLAAVIGEVDGDVYSDERLNARLGDLEWVGQRGLAHERVLDWYAERGPVVPLSLFSLHRDEERVRARLAAGSERLVPLLESLRGRREWGVKLWRRDQEVTTHLAELSPTLRALEEEMAAAAPGRRYLLAKKQEAIRAEELRAVSRRLAHRVLASLQEVAERSAAVPLPAAPPETTRVLLLHAAFLVEDAGFAAFQRRVGQIAHELRAVGFQVEFTGPWPPYHFVEADADGEGERDLPP